jgi:hypothetical protein
VETLSLGLNPSGAVSWHRDIFGNSIALVSFSEPADLLEFSSVAVIFRREHSSRRLLDVLPVISILDAGPGHDRYSGADRLLG